MENVFGLMASGLDVYQTDQGAPFWHIFDFCLGLIPSKSTTGVELAEVLRRFLHSEEGVAAQLASKAVSTTSDGGENLKAMVRALAGCVNATAVLPSLKTPIMSSCLAHYANNAALSGAAIV